ncbi:ribonuclease HII [Scatolibacter rhodanostii]|uniref:ribonuclease HII n=1 Tax=Scatolibacter rhodanostii TaxID=2014781 RepID=UPI000C06C2DD|nr:ribonuclease HII [Scatolibacter rhodanostii]
MNFEFEQAAYAKGYQAVCGIDEVGRGPLIGPVCAAAVILNPEDEIKGLNDSKKLTEKKREILFDIIMERALAVGIGFASSEEIDEINILQATFLAMKRACESLPQKADFALVDGNKFPSQLGIQGEAIVKGDGKSPSIAAASIIAKVSRDRLMVELDREYPQYGFAAHKGYPTAAHYRALDEFGEIEGYRKTFLRKYYAKRKSTE